MPIVVVVVAVTVVAVKRTIVSSSSHHAYSGSSVVSFFIFGLWIWALLAAVQAKRGAFIAMLVFNLLALLLGVSTLMFLCPTPCSTGAPLADILDWSMSLVAFVAIVSAGAVFFGKRQALQAVEQV